MRISRRKPLQLQDIAKTEKAAKVLTAASGR